MGTPSDAPRPGRSVTAKVLALLEAFTAAEPELTLSQLARLARLPLATAHRRAAELLEWGALERDERGRYRIGLRLWEVASLAPRGVGLRDAAMPFLEDLYEVTHENVQLAVREGAEVVFVERIAGLHAVPVWTRVGGRFAMHATGVGLVLLAHAPRAVQEEVLGLPLRRYSEKTVTDPNTLRRVLADVRRSGYAVSDGQVTVDALSVAAPIAGVDGRITAAVSLVVRADGAQPGALAPLVQAAARGITRALHATAAGRPVMRSPPPPQARPPPAGPEPARPETARPGPCRPASWRAARTTGPATGRPARLGSPASRGAGARPAGAGPGGRAAASRCAGAVAARGRRAPTGAGGGCPSGRGRRGTARRSPRCRTPS
ncbi:IclR family transcriptional regulator [Microtetraspora sp. AC03309]|nr:IclR family transcriptional regulator [Microtetraspora sp. AC03309]